MNSDSLLPPMFRGPDLVFLEGLECLCRVGETAEERAFPQVLLIDLSLALMLGPAGRSDDIRDTVDYADVLGRIRKSLEKKSFNLVEAVAETVAQQALQDVRVEGAGVRIRKRSFPGLTAAGVQIWREKAG